MQVKIFVTRRIAFALVHLVYFLRLSGFSLYKMASVDTVILSIRALLMLKDPWNPSKQN